MRIVNLLAQAPDGWGPWAEPEMNPLVENDALQEAQVLDLRFEPLTGTLGVIFELRQALQLREGSTGVLVLRGVQALAWDGHVRDVRFAAWSVGSSVPSVRDDLFGLSLVMWPHPGARLDLASVGAEFYVGSVPGLSEAPPDYGDPATTRSEIASWDSEYEIVSAALFG